MKLRKMVTVSAAALMLAGVGASATNAGAPVHASRRTVRISNLSRQSARLTRQIRRDKSQVKNINREITRLSRKTVKKGKRSKKTVKRHKRAKKESKKNRNVKKASQKNTKLVPVVKHGKVNKKAGDFHLRKGNEVYTFNVNTKGQPITSTEKRFMSLKNYNKKYGKTLTSLNNARMQYILMYQKSHNSKYLMGIQYLGNYMQHVMAFREDQI